MDNHELLNQIASLLEDQTERIEKRLEEHTKQIEEMVEKRLDDHTRRIELKIENDVTNRINALFDGYKLCHEKQWELERQQETLQRQIDDIQVRLAVLENRPA